MLSGSYDISFSIFFELPGLRFPTSHSAPSCCSHLVRKKKKRVHIWLEAHVGELCVINGLRSPFLKTSASPSQSSVLVLFCLCRLGIVRGFFANAKKVSSETDTSQRLLTSPSGSKSCMPGAMDIAGSGMHNVGVGPSTLYLSESSSAAVLHRTCRHERYRHYLPKHRGSQRPAGLNLLSATFHPKDPMSVML